MISVSGEEMKVGICGLGGFAASAAQFVRQFGHRADPPLRFAAACDPARRQMRDRVRELNRHGVEVLDSFEQLLAREDIAGVWLPLPIDLHRPFTRRALAAGKHVLCEKPAAGCVQDVDAMIGDRDAAGLSVLIGFQDVYDPATAHIKRMILEGRIGRVRHATLHACRPRGDWYFNRSAWAGRIRRNDTWVLDSPANNAVSHFINLVLVLLGPTFHASATPLDIEAELYRAAPIENYDTISARATLEGGATFLVLLTHACERQTEPVLRIFGDKGMIERTCFHYRVVTPAGEQTIQRSLGNEVYAHVIRAWSRAMTGRRRDDDLVATLEIARQHTLLVCGASEAAAVRDIDDHVLGSAPGRHGDTVVTIPGIEEVFEHCATNNLMLHESGRLDFTEPPGRFDLRDYDCFTGGRTPVAAGAREA